MLAVAGTVIAIEMLVPVATGVAGFGVNAQLAPASAVLHVNCTALPVAPTGFNEN